MWLLAALTTAVCFGINNTIFKWSSTRHLSKVNIQFFFYVSAFLMTFLYGIYTDELHLTPISLTLGALIGILNANGNIQMSSAFEKGPASLTSALIAANSIFPVLYAGFIFHEQIRPVHWAGISIMILAVIVIQYKPGSKENTYYGPWLLRVMLAVLSFGILGILMKTSSYLHIQPLDVLVTMYGGGSLFLALRLNIAEMVIKEAKIGSFVGLLSVMGFSCYLYALQSGVASIVFPVISLNCLIVILAGYFIFKERLKYYQVVGIFAALVGLVLTKL